MVTEMQTERKTLTPEALKACYDRAQVKSRALDPRLERITKLAPCRYEVIGDTIPAGLGKPRVYTVTVDAAGFHCTCDGAKHPACWHRASAFRLRLAQRCASIAPVNAPPRRKTLEELFDLDDAKRAAAGLL